MPRANDFGKRSTFTVFVYGDTDEDDQDGCGIGFAMKGKTPREALENAAEFYGPDSPWCSQCVGTRWSRRWDGAGTHPPSCETCNGTGAADGVARQGA